MENQDKQIQTTVKRTAVHGLTISTVKNCLPILKDKGVKNSELRCFELASKTEQHIKELPGDQFLKELRIEVSFIKEDLGIVQKSFKDMSDQDIVMHNLQLTRLADFLKRHYSWLTLMEFREAFELAITQKIHLPVDKSGRSYASLHFQKLSLEYVNTILKAYSEFRGKSLVKIKNLLPTKTKRTEEEVANDRLKFIDWFYQLQREAIEEGVVHPTYIFNDFFLKLLKENGFQTNKKQKLEAKVRAFKEMKEYLLQQMSDTTFGKAAFKSALKQTMDAEIPKDYKDKFSYFYKRNLVHVFLTERWKSNKPLKNLK